MEDNVKAKEPRAPKLYEAIITFLGLVVIMSVGIVVFEVSPHIPMFIGVIFAALMALRLGYKWDAVESMMITGISRAMQAILILMIVGMLVGTWILSGTIPTMIYYGLKLLSPSIFLVATVLICSVTSLATGTSWGTMGTMGLALMGIAAGLGIPVGPTAGAILSGAYFGDKMSPLSDTTNLAPAMAGTNVFSHVKYMMKPTVITYIISIAIFSFVGWQFGSGSAEMSSIVELQNAISGQFSISPFLMLPPVIVIVAIAMKIPAIPGITLGILVAAVMSPIFQGLDKGGLGHILDAAMNGYVSKTGIEAVDALLSKGGLMSMMFSVSMTIIAMMFGGVVEHTGQMEVILRQLLKLVRGNASLVVATEATCILSNCTMPEQYISIVIPGRMYAAAYRERDLHPKVLSNALESAGTVSGALIPWNTCGVYMSQTLGLPVWGPGGYGPWAIFNYSMIIINIIFAFLGITTTKMTEEEKKILAETGNVA